MSPPLTGETFPYQRLEHEKLLYLRLHGLPRQSYLFGDRWLTAFSGKRLSGLDLSGLVVFMEGCFGLKTRIPKAFLDSGASVVVASDRETENNTIRVGKAGRFGRDFVTAMLRGKSAKKSLEYAESRAEKRLADAFALVGDGDAVLRKRSF
jgi:hypothetical protein